MLMQCLEATFAKYRSALETSVSSEALSRDFISLIVFNCLLEEKAAMQNAKLNPSFISTSQLLSSTIPVETSPENANSPPLEKSELCLFFETKLIKPITFNGRTYVLRSIADCSLGYSHCSTGSGNLVVVVAKRRYQMSLAYGQLLSSMGMWCSLNWIPTWLIRKGTVGIIHEAQKREEKDRAFCFGVATDGFEYRFWAIDNKSNVSCIDHYSSQCWDLIQISSSSTYDWPKKSERQHIYSIFRAIIRTAILSSLTISPVNGQESAGDSQYPFGFGTISTRVPWQ